MIGKIEKLLKMDDYDLEAVFTPAIVNMLILDIVFTRTLLPIAENTSWWRPVLAIAAPLAAAVVLTRFVMHIFRGVSRMFFEDILYRKDRLLFPTTSMLLLGDNRTSVSKMMKNRVRENLKTLYNITLPTKAKEDADEMEARRTAKDAVYYIFSRTGVSISIIHITLILYLILVVIDFFITKSAAVDYAETLITTFDKLNHDEA